MIHSYIAENIPILCLTWKPDSQGLIIPPEADTEFPRRIEVLFGEEDEEIPIGYASLRREGSQVLANITLRSDAPNPKEVVERLSKLTPAVSFYVLQAKKNTILKLKIYELFLTYYRNDSDLVTQLGDSIRLLRRKKDLN